MAARHKITRAEELPDVCTPQIAADYLGLSRDTVYTLCQLAPCANGIPSYTIGSSRKIDRPDLIQWKEKQRQLSMDRFKDPGKEQSG